VKTKRNRILLLVLSVMLTASLACVVNIGADPTPTAEVEKLVRPSATSEPVQPTTAPAPTQEAQQPAPSGGDDYADYVVVMDDYEIISVMVPTDWNEVDGSPLGDESGISAASIWAAPSIDGFSGTWNTPGVIFDVTNRYDLYGDPAAYLAGVRSGLSGVCTPGAQTVYDDPAFHGFMDRYSNCEGSGTSYVTVVAEPKSGEAYYVSIEVQIVTPKDEAALQNILDSFVVVGDLAALTGGGGFVTVTDDYDSIQVDIPAQWTDVDGGYWESDGQVIGAMITAAANIPNFLSTWDEPGMKFAVSDDVVNFFGGYIMMLDLWREDFRSVCEYTGRYDYEDALYEGKYDEYKNCGGPGGPYYMVLSTRPKADPLAYNILVEVQFGNDADLEYVTRILDTFVVIGSLP